MRLLRAALAATLLLAPSLAAAQVVTLPQVKNAGGANVPSGAAVPIDSTGAEKGTDANPTSMKCVSGCGGANGPGGDPSSTATIGSAPPAKGSFMAGWDGSVARGLLTDTSGRLSTIIYSLPAITGTVGVTGSVAVTGTFWQSTQPVSAASLPLPTGAATAARQDSLLAALGSPYQSGGALPLPLGAATATKQDILLAALGSPYQAGGALPLPAGAATAAKQPAIDTNGDLRVPTVTPTPFYVSIPANTSTEILPALSTRIGYDIQCTGNVAIGVSRTHATLTTSTPGAGANIDLVMPASTTPPQFVPQFVSKLGSTGYATSATACWGQSFAQQ